MLGGATGGAINMALIALAEGIFPNEKGMSLVAGVTTWAIMGALLGMAGGGLGGSIAERKYPYIKSVMNWVTLGAFLGSVIGGLGVSIPIGLITLGNLGAVGGACVGALAGGTWMREKGHIRPFQ